VAIVPKNVRPKVKQGLEQQGLNVIEYDAMDADGRKKALEGLKESSPDLFFQEGKRGAAKVGEDNVIYLFENADASTMPHELAHVFLNQLSQAEGQAFQEDYDIIKAWLGIEGDTITVEQQEKFARGFERYLMTEKAPTENLQSVFDNFKEWLSTIYGTLKDYFQGTEYSADVKQVFDRMLGAEREAQGDKTTRLAEREAQRLYEKYCIEINEDDLQKYQTVTNKDQLDKALIEFDRNASEANQVALGLAQPKEGILPTAYYVIAEKMAIKNRDVEMLQRLATQSVLAEEASKAGQFIQMLSQTDPDSPVKAVADVAKIKTEAYNRNHKVKAKEVIKKEKKQVKKTIEEAYNELDAEIDNFIKDLEC
jgi:hypothetical protein